MRNPIETHNHTTTRVAPGQTPGAADLIAPVYADAAVDAGSSLTLRFARPDDRVALAELASLDSSRPPAEPVLLAEVGGELHAALSLSEHTLVADPFRPTAGLCELLRARAEQLTPTRPGPRFLLRWWLRPRLSPAIS